MGSVLVDAAAQTLGKALASLAFKSPEWEAAHKALGILNKAFNFQKTSDLVPAQIAEMARTQGQSPIGQIMAGGGGAPQGAPGQPPQPPQPPAMAMQ